MRLGTIFGGFLLVILQYAVCALVAPEFESGDDFDLRRFHQREGRTYLLAFLAIMLASLALNAAAGTALGVRNWANQNWIVLAMLPPIVLALAVRTTWAQVVAPLVMVALMVAFPLIYYPALK
jgi:hypothetical protein